MRNFCIERWILCIKDAITVRVLLWITLGSFLYAAGLHFFILPLCINLGGVGGISVILSQYFSISASILLAYINYGLLVIAFLVLGISSAIRTMVGSLFTTVSINLLAVIQPMQTAIIIPNVWSAGVIGAIVVAFGGAILFYCNSSSGGTDIIALIIQKYCHVRIGTALLMSDILLVVMSYFTFRDLQIVCVSVLAFVIKVLGINLFVSLISKCRVIKVQ